MRTRHLTLALASTVLLAWSGCSDSKVRVYDTPKESAPVPPVAAPALPAMPPLATAPTGASRDIQWQTPAGWQEQSGNTVRIASFLIANADGRRADVSVTAFPGKVGGALANINRWRDQLKLGPIVEADLDKAVQPLSLPAGRFSLVDLVSTNPVIDGKFKSRTLGAWLAQPDRTWFFKMNGEDELVASQRDAFIEFLKSIQFSPTTNTPAGPARPATPPIANAEPPAPDTTRPAGATAPATSTLELTWKARLDWAQKPLGQMRKGSFSLRGADGAEADLSIIAFPGAAGGLLPNLNRWREQLHLPPLDEAALPAHTTRIPNGRLSFTLVDFAGTTTTGPTRLIGAVLPFNGETYFFKLTGPDAFVAERKTEFLDFLKTVRTR